MMDEIKAGTERRGGGMSLREDVLSRLVNEEGQPGASLWDRVARLEAILRSPFTWADVDALRDAESDYIPDDRGVSNRERRMRESMAAIADRIAALLPPRDP